MGEQLNKLQIKAEILTVISKLQANPDRNYADKVLEVLAVQEDTKAVLDILLKELNKADEQKVILICFLLIKLCDSMQLEDALWEVLKDPSVKDVTKTIVLNLLKDMGNKVNYDKVEQYFENPEEVIDADTQKLLHVAIVNPEAQIDFLDFVNTLSEFDKKILVESLGDDYSSDDLANILNPLVLFTPTSDLGKIAIGILGETKSQLALNTLLEALEFVDDDEVISLIKKNISKLKISGVREDNTIEFYKSILCDSHPYKSFASYPDGHGNQALIFSREKDTESIQIVAIVINDTSGIIDCFGFNEISKTEFERIVDRFYNGDEHVYIDAHVIKTILQTAEKTTRRVGGKISYEYICWKRLLSDVTTEVVPIELILNSALKQEPLSEDDLEEIYMLDFVQRWFFDTEYSDEFKSLVDDLNSKISENDFKFEFNDVIEQSVEKIFTAKQKKVLDKRILMSAYLRYLSGNKADAGLLFSLYADEDKKSKLAQNIIRKSIYEYYVSLKFRQKEENKMTNIFAMRNKTKTQELSPKQLDLVISIIEGLWVR